MSPSQSLPFPHLQEITSPLPSCRGWNPSSQPRRPPAHPPVATLSSQQPPATSHQLNCTSTSRLSQHIPTVPFVHMAVTLLPVKAVLSLSCPAHPARSQAMLMVVEEAPTTYLISFPSSPTSWPPLHSWNMPGRCQVKAFPVLPTDMDKPPFLPSLQSLLKAPSLSTRDSSLTFSSPSELSDLFVPLLSLEWA